MFAFGGAAGPRDGLIRLGDRGSFGVSRQLESLGSFLGRSSLRRIVLFTNTADTINSVSCIGDTVRLVELPHDLQDETHESEFSEGSEQFSDEDSDYGNCA